MKSTMNKLILTVFLACFLQACGGGGDDTELSDSSAPADVSDNDANQGDAQSLIENDPDEQEPEAQTPETQSPETQSPETQDPQAQGGSNSTGAAMATVYAVLLGG